MKPKRAGNIFGTAINKENKKLNSLCFGKSWLFLKRIYIKGPPLSLLAILRLFSLSLVLEIYFDMISIPTPPPLLHVPDEKEKII